MMATLQQCNAAITARATVQKNCTSSSGGTISYYSEVTLYGRARTGVKDAKLPVGFADVNSAKTIIQAAIDDCKPLNNWIRQATSKNETEKGCKFVAEGEIRHKWEACKSQLGGYGQRWASTKKFY